MHRYIRETERDENRYLGEESKLRFMRETERDLRRRAVLVVINIIVSQSGGFGHSRSRSQRRRHYWKLKGRNFEREKD